MRKMLLISALALLLVMIAAAASAETYSFGDIRAQVEIPSDYETVLTPYNLSSKADWIASQGLDYDALANSFEAEGILLQAIDEETNRTLVISALRDTDAQTYFDLNNQDEDMRKEFRVSHTNGSVYSILGYTYSSAKWANYGKVTLRFLQTQYTLRQNGQLVCSGYQRRTIRNGYTITLDMQVRDRTAKEADNTALEKVMKTFTFTEILPMPELPIKLTVSAAPPAETNEDTFTVKGTTARKATVTVTAFSLGSAGGQTFQTTANGSGAFSVKVKLPAQGVYSVTLTSEAEGAIAAQRLYSVTFQQGILPVDLVTHPGETLNDETVFSGTTVAGAKIQLAISGPITYSKSVTGSQFNFKVDTSAEGAYQFVLTVTKKGLQERIFTFTAVRSYTDAEREDKIRASAKKMTYENLPKSENRGKTVVETGFITGVEKNIDEWVVTFALTQTGSGYKDIVYLICREEPAWTVGDKVKVYGVASGTFSEINEEGKIKSYPRIDVSIIEATE
ncbi:MAG: hypothetical protein IKN04_12655 [Clostridia bacterium]|nr:hypothetical protein [Clostridia bacterium]